MQTHEEFGDSAARSARETAQQAAESVRQQASTTASQIRDKAREAVDEARQRGQSMIDDQKCRLAENVHDIAEAFRGAGERLHDEHHPNLAQYADLLAERGEDVADYIRDADLRSMMEDARGVVRERPGLFLGAMFVVGLAAARFVRAAGRSSSGRYSEEDVDMGEHTTTSTGVRDIAVPSSISTAEPAPPPAP